MRLRDRFVHIILSLHISDKCFNLRFYDIFSNDLCISIATLLTNFFVFLSLFLNQTQF